MKGEANSGLNREEPSAPIPNIFAGEHRRTERVILRVMKRLLQKHSLLFLTIEAVWAIHVVLLLYRQTLRRRRQIDSELEAYLRTGEAYSDR